MNNWWLVARGPVAAAVCVVSLVAGCGRPNRAAVSGRLVRSDGALLIGARVIATSPDTGKSAYGQTDENGEFELGVSEAGDGVPPGEYEVIIVESRGDSEIPSPATISEKYQNKSTSGIRLSVAAGDSKQLDLSLDPP